RIKVIKFSHRPKVQILLNGFDAFLRDLAKVGSFRKEPLDDPNTVFHSAFILGGIGSGKVGVSVQLFGNFLVTGPDASGSLSKVRVLMNPGGIPKSWLVMWVAHGTRLA